VRFRDFEIEVITTLVGDQLEPEILEPVLKSDSVDVYFSGAGYFATASDEALPTTRFVFSSPIIIGRSNDLEVGFAVFVQDRELTLDCYNYVGDFPDSFRDQDVSISAT